MKLGNSKRNPTPKFKLYMRNRYKDFFKGDVFSVTSVNDVGEFDILPKHANFVTLIHDYVILDKGLPTEKLFSISQGVLSLVDGNLDIYVL